MRRIMVDHARQRQALKRGGGALKITLDEAVHAVESRAVELLALDEALEKLAAFDKRKADVVEMRYFGGLTMEEIADVLKVHVNTVTPRMERGAGLALRHAARGKAWMQSERWRTLHRYFPRCPGTPARRAQRASSTNAAPGDQDLRDQVETLLKYHDEAGDFIASPAVATAPELLADDPDALIGQQLGNYRIDGVLGVGGMGVVYLAYDERLGRKVGLKLLPRAFVNDEAQLARLKLEARTASALNHPNIVTVHEIGQVDSTHYIAIEFIEGVTLRERITQGSVPPDEALEIADAGGERPLRRASTPGLCIATLSRRTS